MNIASHQIFDKILYFILALLLLLLFYSDSNPYLASLAFSSKFLIFIPFLFTLISGDTLFSMPVFFAMLIIANLIYEFQSK